MDDDPDRTEINLELLFSTDVADTNSLGRRISPIVRHTRPPTSVSPRRRIRRRWRGNTEPTDVRRTGGRSDARANASRTARCHQQWNQVRFESSKFYSTFGGVTLWFDWTDTSLRYRHWRMCFERLLQAFARWQPGILFDIAAQPILEYLWIDSYSQPSLRTQFKVATVCSIHTQSLSWCSTGLVLPYVLPRRDEGSGKPYQSIEPHRILAPTRDSNQEPPGPESRVVTTILSLHTILIFRHVHECNCL